MKNVKLKGEITGKITIWKLLKEQAIIIVVLIIITSFLSTYP